MSNLSYNIALYHGPSQYTSCKAVVIDLEGAYLMLENCIAAQEKSKLQKILPVEVFSRLNLDEIHDFNSLLKGLIKALLNFKSSFPYEIEEQVISAEKTRLILPYDLGEQMLKVAQVAVKIVNFAVQKNVAVDEDVISKIRNWVQHIAYLSPSTVIAMMLGAANSKNIPYYVIDRMNFIISYGQGVNAKIFNYGSTENDSSFGVTRAKDKSYTHSFLRSLGLPASRQYMVGDYKQCVELINKIGFPIVMKPPLQGRGRGVTANIKSLEAVKKALRGIREYSQDRVIVEKHVEGDDHRFYVYNGKVISMYRRRAPYVDGDGKHSIQELINIENQRRFKNPVGSNFLMGIETNEAVLNYLFEQQLTIESVPAPGKRVFLSSIANVSIGGTGKFIEVSDIHPDNIQMALMLAKAFRLEMVGIDFMTRDISKSWQEEGKIIEVNAYPFLNDVVSSEVFETEFANRKYGKIDTTLIVSDDQGFVDQYYQKNSTDVECPGFASSKNTLLAGKGLRVKSIDLFHRINALYLNPECDAVFVSMTLDEVRKNGLPTDCITDIVIDEKLELTEKDQWLVEHKLKIENENNKGGE